MDNFYPIPAGALVLKFMRFWKRTTSKKKKKKKTAKNYNKSDLVFKINFTPAVTLGSFA